jgi:acyl-CoA synthetase (AMP-forming)/AMP-acid ligase II
VAAAVVLRDGWGWRGPRCQALPPGGGVAPVDGAPIGPRCLDAAALQLHCRGRGLAGFKLPRVVAVAASLPVNATGKVVKREVRREVEALLARPPPSPRL